MSVVYFVQAGAGGPIKIGVAGDIGTRILALQTGCPEPIVVLAAIPGTADDERRLHRMLAPHRHRGEWFRPAPDVLSAIECAKQGRFPDAAPGPRDPGFSHLNNLVGMIRAHVRCRGRSKAGLAKASGLHPNTLLDCDNPDWNPSLSTLRAVEAYFLHPDQMEEDA